MNKIKKTKEQTLAANLFREEYGKIVSVMTSRIGYHNIELVEDIVQETFYKAVKHWQIKGIPDNPKAWLYVTSKNVFLNHRKKVKIHQKYVDSTKSIVRHNDFEEDIDFSDQIIADGQLKMMFACCQPTISQRSQLALILKILCGFNNAEIARAFFDSPETIKRRLSRARAKLRSDNECLVSNSIRQTQLPTVLQAIYLLFNEGYSPSEKEETIRKDLCFEAIRLAEIICASKKIMDKSDCRALLSLMYLNASRFEARKLVTDKVIEMKDQDRSLWNKALIDQGLQYLKQAALDQNVSIYHILAAISANHCTARSFEKTDWHEILALYDALLRMTDSPMIRLNRSIALANVEGEKKAIEYLERLDSNSDITEHHLYHSTIAEYFLKEGDRERAIHHLEIAIQIASNKRDQEIFQKKLDEVVPL